MFVEINKNYEDVSERPHTRIRPLANHCQPAESTVCAVQVL